MKAASYIVNLQQFVVLRGPSSSILHMCPLLGPHNIAVKSSINRQSYFWMSNGTSNSFSSLSQFNNHSVTSQGSGSWCHLSTKTDVNPTGFKLKQPLRTYVAKRAAKARTSERDGSGQGRSLQEASQESGAVTLSLGEKVKENAKTGGYGVVILMGVAVTGAMLWFILSELFSSDSPNNIYTHAFKLCKLSPEIQDALGIPIKCHGEETRRGWRRHVSHVEFIQGSTKFLRMRFYIEGTFNKGTVHLEKKKTEGGKYEYTYLTVEVDGYPPRRIDVHF